MLARRKEDCFGDKIKRSFSAFKTELCAYTNFCRHLGSSVRSLAKRRKCTRRPWPWDLLQASYFTEQHLLHVLWYSHLSSLPLSLRWQLPDVSCCTGSGNSPQGYYCYVPTLFSLCARVYHLLCRHRCSSPLTSFCTWKSPSPSDAKHKPQTFVIFFHILKETI